jgi:hypothetical protein
MFKGMGDIERDHKRYGRGAQVEKIRRKQKMITYDLKLLQETE